MAVLLDRISCWHASSRREADFHTFSFGTVVQQDADGQILAREVVLSADDQLQLAANGALAVSPASSKRRTKKKLGKKSKKEKKQKKDTKTKAESLTWSCKQR